MEAEDRAAVECWHRLEEAEREAERLREKVSALEARRDSLVEKWNKAEDDAERLREALERYGTHRAECATNTAPPRRGPCDCGWAALDRGGEGEELRQLGVPYTDDLDREGEGKFKGATSDSPFTGKDREG
jgi:hypothetical protein